MHSSARTRILLEVPQPNSLNGKQSWYQTGFAYGVWQGALASHGFEVCTAFQKGFVMASMGQWSLTQVLIGDRPAASRWDTTMRTRVAVADYDGSA